MSTPGTRSVEPVAAAKAPVGLGVITAIGLVLALLVMVLGAVGVHDALTAAGAVNGRSWVNAVAGQIDGLTPAVWLVLVGPVLALLGLWLVASALRPRPRTGVALEATTGVVLRPRDIAHLARTAAQDVNGVTAAKAKATSRKVTVAVTATTAQGIQGQVIEAVGARLAAIRATPTIRVNVSTEGAN